MTSSNALNVAKRATTRKHLGRPKKKQVLIQFGLQRQSAQVIKKLMYLIQY